MSEDPELWCMTHGMPDGMPDHDASGDCLMRVMRDDEMQRIRELADQLPFDIEETNTPEGVLLRTKDGRAGMAVQSVTLVLAREVLRLRRLMFGDLIETPTKKEE